MTPFVQDIVASPEQFGSGVRIFGRLFTRWMDLNGWSHPRMAALAKAALGGTGWLHSSQISGLRHARLESPGPRTFIAIERLNYYLYRYVTEKTPIPGTDSSQYREAVVVTENGQPPPLGWWVEVFCGYRVPQDFDIGYMNISDLQAAQMSEKWAALIRRLMTSAGVDLITELNQAIHAHYPARDEERLAKLHDVIFNRYVWSPDELANEMPAIMTLTKAFGGPDTEGSLIEYLM